MKTTIDLPADLVRAFKLYAVHHGLKLNTTAVAILRAKLELPEKTLRAKKPLPKTLPLLRVRPLTAPRVQPMSAQAMSDFIKKADLEADTERHEKPVGH